MSFIHIGNVLRMSDQMQYEAGNQLVSLSLTFRGSRLLLGRLSKQKFSAPAVMVMLTCLLSDSTEPYYYELTLNTQPQIHTTSLS